MPTFRLTIVFAGIDFEDETAFEALTQDPNILWRGENQLAFAHATPEAPSSMEAAYSVVQYVMRAVPTASPVRLDDDLVSISDIAARIGMNREAVRNWANGTRHDNFPAPRGTVGSGMRVWTWADVNSWLRANLGLGDEEQFPTALEAAEINSWLLSPIPLMVPHADAVWTSLAVDSRWTFSPVQTIDLTAPNPEWVKFSWDVDVSAIDPDVHAEAA